MSPSGASTRERALGGRAPTSPPRLHLVDTAPAVPAGVRVGVAEAVLTTAAAVGFWLVSVYLVLGTSLLWPYYQFHRSRGLWVFVLAEGAVATLVALGQGRWLGLTRTKALALGWLTSGAVVLGLLFFKLQPVSFAELADNRLFFAYYALLSALLSLTLAVAAGVVLHRAGRALLGRRPSRAVVLLPLALLAVYPQTSHLLPALAVAAALELAARWPALRRSTATVAAGLGRLVRGAGRWFGEDRRFQMSVFLTAFALRAGYAVRVAGTKAREGFLWDDAVIYEKGARELSYEGYSLFLRGIYEVFGHSFVAVGVIQALLGALTCVLIFRLGRRLLGRATARWAAAASVIFGPLLLMPALHARETLLTFLLTLTVAAALTLDDGSSALRHAAVGFAMGLVALVKVITLPILALIALYRVRVGGRAGGAAGGIRRAFVHAAVLLLVGSAVLGTKFLVGRPLDVPVGKGTAAYASFAYFAGNHPLSREEHWFDLSREQYEQLREMGFNVGADAGTPEAVATWQENHPRIAYCDPVTFETNGWNLVRYNLRHPLRAVEVHLENLQAFFLGVMRHHRIFDPVFLLNRSAFSVVARVFGLLVLLVGWIAAWRALGGEPRRREGLLLVSGIIGYFVAIHTIFIGVYSYAVPVMPYLLILQIFGLLWLWWALKDAAGEGEMLGRVT